MLYVYTYVQISIVRPCIGFLRGGPISEGPQKTELIFAAYSIRHDDAAFLGQVPVPLVLGCYPYSIFLRIACLLHRIIRLFRRHETRFNVFFVCLTDLTCTVHSFIFYGQVVVTAEHKDPFRENVVFTLNQFPTFMYITLIKCVLHPL